jgi:hypothetical protein
MTIRAVILLGLLGSTAVFASPVVSNVRASQRDGSNLVDLYYDLSDVIEGATVSVELSSDGGSNYLPLTNNITGDYGEKIGNGSRKHIIWNAGVALPESFFEAMRFRVTADEYIAPSVSLRIMPGDYSVDEGVPSVIFGGLVHVEGDFTSVSYQWFHDGYKMSGCTDYWIEIFNVSRSDDGVYSVKVIVDGVVYSDSARLTVYYEDEPIDGGDGPPLIP